jgi:hypothetical protein
MPWIEADRRLRIAADDIIKEVLEELARTARDRGSASVFLALDNVSDPPATDWAVLDEARASGILVFDLLDLWRGRDQANLRIAPWDKHPNAVANELIAESVYNLILRYRTELALDAPIAPQVGAP